MATLIKTDGSKLEIQPQNGLGFQLDELQKFVDGYIDIINLHNATPYEKILFARQRD